LRRWLHCYGLCASGARPQWPLTTVANPAAAVAEDEGDDLAAGGILHPPEPAWVALVAYRVP
jgi:hypothetical protein